MNVRETIEQAIKTGKPQEVTTFGPLVVKDNTMLDVKNCTLTKVEGKIVILPPLIARLK